MNIRARIEPIGEIRGQVDTPTARYPAYNGPYEIIPTREAQTLSTAGKHTLMDFVIRPIPSNYGLITYNGFGITVS